MLHKAIPAAVVLLCAAAPTFAQTPTAARPDYYSEDYVGPGNKGEGQQSLVARFRVRVPVRAELWFDAQKTKQQGAVRQFVTDTLNPERIYTYRVRARWVEDGITVEKTVRVRAIAGNRVTINFIRPSRPTLPPAVARSAPASPARPVQFQPPVWRAPVP